MWGNLLLIVHLLASDIQLPADIHDRVAALTGRYVPQVELVPQERPQLVELPPVAALPVKQTSDGGLVADAKRAIVLDADSGMVLYSKNPDEPASIASIAKLMVALVTLERMESLDQVLTVPTEIGSLEEYSTLVGFAPGDRVTVGELLEGLMVASGNDAALTLADGLAGSESRFVSWMNDKAERLGLTNTHFANSSGLDAEGGYSTAREVAYMLLEAGKVPLLRELSAQRSATVVTERGDTYYAQATDELLGQTDLSIELAKTGTTDLAGRCFTVLARDGDQRLAVVVLDSQDRFGEAEQLAESALDVYAWPDAVMGAGSSERGDSAFGG